MPEAMSMMMALMTKRKRPRVRIVAGSVTTMSMGRTRLSSSEMTAAVRSTAQKELTSTPGRSQAPTMTAMPSTKMRVRQPGLLL